MAGYLDLPVFVYEDVEGPDIADFSFLFVKFGANGHNGVHQVPEFTFLELAILVLAPIFDGLLENEWVIIELNLRFDRWGTLAAPEDPHIPVLTY